MAELFRVFKMTLPATFGILNNVSIRRNICLNFLESSKEKINLSSGKSELQMFFSYFRPPSLCPSEGHKNGASILISIYLWGTLCQITRVR